jgi:hypothetical protein
MWLRHLSPAMPRAAVQIDNAGRSKTVHWASFTTSVASQALIEPKRCMWFLAPAVQWCYVSSCLKDKDLHLRKLFREQQEQKEGTDVMKWDWTAPF